MSAGLSPNEVEVEDLDEYLPPGWKIVTELVSGSTKFYRNVNTGQKSLVHPFLRRSQSVLKTTETISIMDQATIRAENEFQLGLVPDAIQVRLLRMSVHTVEAMTDMTKLKEAKKEAKDSPEFGDQVQKLHLFEELLTTEKKYVDDLDIIIKHFLVRMTNSRKVNREDLRVIFSNVEFIRDFHAHFLTVLENVMGSSDSLTIKSLCIGKLLFALKPHFNVYLQYGANQAHSQDRMALLRKMKDFADLIKECRVGSGQLFELNDLLHRPIQRFLKYPLLLTKISQLTKPGSPESAIWTKTLNFFNTLASDINERKRETEQLSAQNAALIESIQGLDPAKLVLYGKLLLHDDIMLKKQQEENEEDDISNILQTAWVRRHALLFERMIVFCYIEQSESHTKVLKFHEEYSLTKVVVHDEKTEEDVMEDYDDDDDGPSSDDLSWTLSVEHLRKKFTYEIKHLTSKDKHRWYESAYALNQRLRPLFFKKTLYRKMLSLIFVEPKVLADMVMKINRSMLRQQANSVIDLLCTKFFDSLESESLAEYYLLKFIKAIIAAEISSLKNVDEFLMGDSITLKVCSVFFQRPDSTEYLRLLLTPLLADLVHQDTFPEGDSPSISRNNVKRSNSNESLPSSILSKQSSQSSILSPSNASIISSDEDGNVKKRTNSFGSFSDITEKFEKKRLSFTNLKRTLRKSDKSNIDFNELAGKSSSDGDTIEDLGSNIPKLRAHVENIGSAITNSYASLPYGIRFICACLKDFLLKKHKDAPPSTYLRAVGSVIYFRYINSAIISPDSYLIASEVSAQRRQNLVKIAKVLQMAASNQKYDAIDPLVTLNSTLETLTKKFSDFFEEATKITAPKKQAGSSKKAVLNITPEVLYSLQTLMVEFLCDVSLVSTDAESATNLSSEELVLPKETSSASSSSSPTSTSASKAVILGGQLKIKSKVHKPKKATKVVGGSPLIDILCILGSPPEELDLGPPEDNAPVKFTLM